jgi:hypothetical protein
MVASFPMVTLEQVHGGLAFYVSNQREIDAYLAEGQRTSESQHLQSKQTNAELIASWSERAVRVRFQADAGLDGHILRELRRVAPEIDIRPALDAGFEGLEDPEVWRVASDSGRVLVSQDRRLCRDTSLVIPRKHRAPESDSFAKLLPSPPR